MSQATHYPRPTKEGEESTTFLPKLNPSKPEVGTAPQDIYRKRQ
jgi:hypothetical protein